jgi:hypothetical protein
VGWIYLEAHRLSSPDLANVFVRGSALQHLEALGEIVGGQKVGEVLAQLLVSVVVVLYGGPS